MITDSCNCCGRSGHGCKAFNRGPPTAWCPVCDRNKVRRRCQSEGLYQEGDPLKELNRCCDRGCDLHNRSTKCSQIKKTDFEMNEKKIACAEDTEMDRGDNYYGHSKKHHSRVQRDKTHNEAGLQDNSSGNEVQRHQRIQKYPDFNLEKYRPLTAQHENSKIYKRHTIGDYHHVSTKGKHSGYEEKSSIEFRERYIREMEILRSRLNFLKGGLASDNKRMRQRSESEPGFADVSGGVPKRARDNSPKKKIGGRKLPANPNNQTLHRFPVKQNVPFQRETKSLSPSSTKTKGKIINKAQLAKEKVSSKNAIQNVKVSESDEDHDSLCDDDLVKEYLDVSTASDDDSTTPLTVGESLKCITLNETLLKFQDLHNPDQSGDHPCLPVNTVISDESYTEVGNLFRSSLFPNVPPYVKFFMHDIKGPALPSDITKLLKWKLSSITPIVIRRTLLNSGFKLVRSELNRGNFEQYYDLIYIPPHRNENFSPPYPRSSRFSRKARKESNDWTGQWGKHMKSFVFKTLKDFQKLNHFPGTFQIGRKDRLWKNMYRLMTKFGKKEFGFIPKTYILPQDRKLLRTAWEKASGPGSGQWIVKPPAAARGTGIKVVHKWGQIPKKKSLIVQKYIAQPYLINGSKFDLRLYVLMTSIHPLRIYLYDDGLVRFASVKYSEDLECLSNRFMHLTNYSINKFSTQYQANADASACNGHKWSLRSLWTYLTKEGVNVKALKKNLVDLVIKTIISGESNINILSKNNLPSRYCSYELFGIDVLLDHTLKPWLLEVNISPSLHSASPLDLAVKGPLVTELLNIAGFQIPAKLTKEQEEEYLAFYGIKEKTHTICYDKRLYWTSLSKEEKVKQENFMNLPRREYLQTILEDLTPDDVRHLIQFEDELTQLRRFEKIFPTHQTHSYHHFFESPRYYNMMLDAWETKYQRNRKDGILLLVGLCHQKLHLNVPVQGGKTKSSPSQSDLSGQVHQEAEADSESDNDKEVEEEMEREISSKDSSQRVNTAVKGLSSRQKTPPKLTVVSKPLILASHLLNRKAKQPTTPKSPSVAEETIGDIDTSESVPLQETCIKMIAEFRQNSLKYPSESKSDSLKHFSNCKLENSILNETLSSGKSVLSPTKHIHNACIQMNTSS